MWRVSPFGLVFCGFTCRGASRQCGPCTPMHPLAPGGPRPPQRSHPCVAPLASGATKQPSMSGNPPLHHSDWVMAQGHCVACGSIWGSKHHFGGNGGPQNLGHQGASGAVLPYVACGLPNVDVGLTNRPIRNHWNFFSAGTQSPTHNNWIVAHLRPAPHGAVRS